MVAHVASSSPPQVHFEFSDICHSLLPLVACILFLHLSSSTTASSKYVSCIATPVGTEKNFHCKVAGLEDV